MFSLLLAYFFPLFLLAAEVRENYNGVRALGMGGASVAVVNDETALLVNPSALGKLRESYGTILDPECEGNPNLQSMYSSSPFTDPLDLPQVRDTTNVSRNTQYHAKCQIFPSFVLRNFGIGFNYKEVLDAKMNTAGTVLDTFYQDDMALHLGVSLAFFDGRFKIGAMGKMISRIEISGALDPAQSLGVEAVGTEGVGIGGDLSLMMTAPIAWLPTLAIVGRDIGGTAFTGGSGVRANTVNRPAKIQQDIDIGIGFFPIHSNKSRSTFTIEAQKVVEMGTAISRNRYYHVGYEYNYADLFFVRAGVNQQYWTAGIELASERTQIQIASYGEDIGVDGVPEEDRRYVVKFAFRF
jgi:hypothetical protein